MMFSCFQFVPTSIPFACEGEANTQDQEPEPRSCVSHGVDRSFADHATKERWFPSRDIGMGIAEYTVSFWAKVMEGKILHQSFNIF